MFTLKSHSGHCCTICCPPQHHSRLTLSSPSMLYIEDDFVSPRNLSPVLKMDRLDLGKGHKSDGDHEGPPTPSQVTFLAEDRIYQN